MTRPYLTDDDPLDKGYLDNDVPGPLKVLFIAIAVWGVLFALYFIFSGYNSERRFDEARSSRTAPTSYGR